MFAYNPAVTDRSAEILANANNTAAAIQFQGMQNFGQSIGNAMQSLGDGYAKAQENKMTSEYLDQMAEYYAQTPGPDGQTPLMTQEDLAKFSKASLGAKQGMIAPRQAQYDQMLKNSYLELQMAGHIDRLYQQMGNQQTLANQRAANQQAARQPAANQVPIGLPPDVNQIPASTNPPPAPVQGATEDWRNLIPPRPTR